MQEHVKRALEDLLTVMAVSSVTPIRVQEWQAAARAVLAEAAELAATSTVIPAESMTAQVKGRTP